MASPSPSPDSEPSFERDSDDALLDAFEKVIEEETPDKQEIALLRQRLKREQQLKARDRRYAKELEKRLAIAEERVEFALAISQRSSEPVSFTPKRHKSSDAVVHIVHSDLHVGETVDPARVNGANRYDEEIAHESFNQLWDLSYNILEWRRKGSLRIETGVLALIGDLMTGHLHEDQRRTNSMHPFEEVGWLLDRYEYHIPRFLDRTGLKKLFIPCCRGNHGRNYEGKKRYALASEDSYEQFLYGRLAKVFKGDKRIEFIISESEFTYGEIFGMRMRYMHGDQFRFQGGVGGIAVPLLRFIQKLDQADPRGRAKHNFMGHWHQWMNLGHVTVNGSLIGTTTYGAGLGMYDSPKQDFSLWTADDGLVDSAPICIQRKV